jgi:ABC-2 type transport system permease protein
MHAVLTILAKDLRLRLRDRSALVVGILTPFGLAFVLNLILGGVDDFSANFAVVDDDHGEVADAFVEATGHLGDDIEVTTGLSEAEARREVDGGSLDAAFVIPAGFTFRVLGLQPAELQVIGNADADIPVRIARGVAERFAAQVDAVRLSVATASPPGTPPDGALIAAARQQAPPVELTAVAAPDRQLDTTTYRIAGLAALFVFFLVQYGVLGLLEEQQAGTLARLLVAPIPRWSVVVAKALVSVVVGLVALTVLAVGSTLVMGADWGDPAAVAALIVGLVVAAVSITGVVAAVARTAEQAGNVQTVVALVLGLLGGSLFPLTRGGGLLSQLSALTPNYWFLQGLGDGRVGGLADALPAVGALVAFALVMSAVSVVVLRVRRGSRLA